MIQDHAAIELSRLEQIAFVTAPLHLPKPSIAAPVRSCLAAYRQQTDFDCPTTRNRGEASMHAAQIAAMAVMVNAKDKAAEASHAHSGITPLQQHSARMFLPMKTVASPFA